MGIAKVFGKFSAVVGNSKLTRSTQSRLSWNQREVSIFLSFATNLDTVIIHYLGVALMMMMMIARESNWEQIKNLHNFYGDNFKGRVEISPYFP